MVQNMVNETIILMLLLILQGVSVTSAENDKLSAISFETNYASDLYLSTYKENYISIKISTSDVEIKSLSYCFRAKLYTILRQCIFSGNILFEFRTRNYGYVYFQPGLFIMYQLKENLVPLKWYHFCISYNQCHFKMMVNGEIIEDQNLATLGCANNSTILLPSSLQVGSCVGFDSYSKSHSAGPLSSLTRGALADFNMWSGALSTEQMKNFTLSCNDIDINPTIINWNERSVMTVGSSAKFRSFMKSEVCYGGQYVEKKSVLVLPHKETYKKAKKTCELLGGKLPLPASLLELQHLKSLFANNDHHQINMTHIRNLCQKRFWMPIIQVPGCNNTILNNCKWIEDANVSQSRATFLQWTPYQPNGRSLQQCVMWDMDDFEYSDQDCDEYYCTLCQFKGPTTFNLRGAPKHSMIDDNYIFLPEDQTWDRLVFAGYKKTKIQWRYNTRMWLIEDESLSMSNLGHYNQTPNSDIPIGRFSWHLKQNSETSEESMYFTHLKLSKVSFSISYMF